MPTFNVAACKRTFISQLATEHRTPSTEYQHKKSMLFSTTTRISLFVLIGLLFAFTDSDNKPYPTDYFIPPVKTTMRLSGTFGELRSNHFHGGIDIKGSIGVPLYAIGEGYVSRIKVEAAGYGNALYINHPNGYTSVYAHMNSFIPELAAYVKSEQYGREQFAVDLYPEKGRFTIEKGQRIGEMGTTGYSFGPHLHFEIRHSSNGAPINPLLFGMPVEDHQQPRMHQLKVYALNEDHETEDAQILSLVNKAGGYGVNKDTVYVNADRVGFGLKVYDHMDGVSNWNGIYNLDVFLEDELIYNFELESFTFAESRYLNAHLDYAEQQLNKAYFNRCYRLPGNRLSIYNTQENDGVVRLSQKRAKKVHMVASDVAGNESMVTFWVKQRPGAARAENQQPYNYLLPYNQESVVDNGSMQMYIPRGALYENCYLQYQLLTDRSDNVYSSVHQIHYPTTPIHRYYDLSIRPVVLPESLRNKAFIAMCGEDNEVTNYGGSWKNGMLHTQVRTFGDFCIMVDEVPPTVTPSNFRADLRRAHRIDFIIKDNYDTGGRTRGLTYRATIDGKWVLMKYDYKNDRLTHYFEDDLSPGQHQFRLEVRDALDNETVFERTFTR